MPQRPGPRSSRLPRTGQALNAGRALQRHDHPLRGFTVKHLCTRASHALHRNLPILFPAMISLAQGRGLALPFFFVQLAPALGAEGHSQ